MKSSKPPFKLLFIMDAFENIGPDDTTVWLMTEAQNRGHHVYHCHPNHLAGSATEVYATVSEVGVDYRPHFVVKQQLKKFLKDFHCIWVRKDPPFDMQYLYLTYVLEPLISETLIINDPVGIRTNNEKLSIFNFPHWIPPSFVSALPDAILRFQDKLKSDLVIKPLNQKGGTDITLIPLKSRSRRKTLYDLTHHMTRSLIAQKFLSKVCEAGDKRILLLNGKFLGAFGRVPKKGDFLSNMSKGGTIKKVQLTVQEKKMIKEIKPYCRKQGLYLAGIDTIDNRLTEINVTSPAGIPEINSLCHTALETKVIDWLEKKIRKRYR